MAQEQQVTFQRHRQYLKPTGPQAVGILHDSQEVPPYKHIVHDPLETRTMDRPAQGKNELSDTNVFRDQGPE